MPTTYTNLGITQPGVGEPSTRNAWGGLLNTDMDLIDDAISGILTLSVAGAANVVLTSTQGAANQFRNAHFEFTGILTGSIYVLFPSGVTCNFTVDNQTTGAFTLGVGVNSGGSPAGTTVTVPQGDRYFLLSDGTDVTLRTTNMRGPSSATDNAAVRFDATTGQLVQNSALLIADTTGSLSRSGNGGIPVQGTNTNDNASAGYVGEYQESDISASIPLTTGVNANLTSLSLTAGDWDVTLIATYGGGATTTLTYTSSSLSLVSATQDSTNGRRFNTFNNGQTPFSTAEIMGVVPTRRFSLSGTTTIYAVVQAAFGVSTCSVYGNLSARRVR